MTVVLLFLALFMTGCQNAKPNNPATRYADNLHDDVRKAESTADVASKKIGEYNTTVEKTADTE